MEVLLEIVEVHPFQRGQLRKRGTLSFPTHFNTSEIGTSLTISRHERIVSEGNWPRFLLPGDL